MHVRIAIPDLFWPTEADEIYDSLTVPAMERLVSKGRRRRGPGESLEAWLLGEFAVDFRDDLPAAPYSLLADGGEPGAEAWVRADPVHLHLARDELLVADALTFTIAREEAEALVESLNRHFGGDGLMLFPLRPDRWYLRVPEVPALASAPLASVRGRALASVLPQGGDASRWQAIVNEMQMLLHAHPVNEAREARGEPPVNSVWLWGAGRLGSATSKHGLRVFADDPLARGLALAARTPSAPLPASADALLASGEKSLALVVLDALRGPAAYGEAGAWHERLQAIERAWIAPLVAAVQAGAIGMVSLHVPCEASSLHAELTRQDLRYFWRRARALGDFA